MLKINEKFSDLFYVYSRLRPRKPKTETTTTEVPTKAARKKIEGENTPNTSSNTPDTKQGRKSLSDLFEHRGDKVILLIHFL